MIADTMPAFAGTLLSVGFRKSRKNHRQNAHHVPDTHFLARAVPTAPGQVVKSRKRSSRLCKVGLEGLLAVAFITGDLADQCIDR